MTSEEMERVRSALQLFSSQLSSHPVVYAVMTFGYARQDGPEIYQRPQQTRRNY
jgi:hypothetical protein